MYVWVLLCDYPLYMYKYYTEYFSSLTESVQVMSSLIKGAMT